MRKTALLVILACLPLLTAGENSKPTDKPISESIPPAQDIARPGIISLSIDASDVTRGIFQIIETIPVTAGPLTLLYPKWLPGNHNDSGQILKLAGLKFTGDGQPLSWRRDAVDVFAFHINVPTGISSV